MSGSPFNIQGVSYSSPVPTTAPSILILGGPKSGKTTLTTTLFDYPEPGMQPLLLAADPTGVDVCAKHGFRVANLKFRDMPGTLYADKVKYAIDALEKGILSGPRPGSIVTDCYSTLAEKGVTDAQLNGKNPDPRSWYNEALQIIRILMTRLADLNIPQIGYAWLSEAEIHEDKTPSGQKRVRMQMGGPQIMGKKATAQVGGKHDLVLLLDVVKRGVDAPGADQDGYVRELRTKNYNNIVLGGRYALPDPCPPHLGWILNVLMGRVK